MTRLWLLSALALGANGCAHRSTCGPAQYPVGRAAPVSTGTDQIAPPPPPAVVSPWVAMPVRVVAWTPDGEEDLGTWPEAPGEIAVTLLPNTPYYVEPIGELDAAGLATLVGLVRTEHVPGLSLRGQRVAAALPTITELPELKALLLDETDVDGAAIATLQPGQLAIERISLQRTLVDDAGVTALVGSLGPSLVAVDLEDCPVGDVALRMLTTRTHARSLMLAGTRISDSGGAMLADLPDLDVIDLGGTRVGAKTIAALRTLHPRQLFLDHTHVGKEIATLAPLAPDLTRFDVSELAAYRPTDADVSWLARAPNLVELGLNGAKITDAVAVPATRAAALHVVHLADTKITMVTIDQLVQRGELRDVDLAHTPVDSPHAAALLALPQLRALRLDGDWVTDAALAGPVGPALEELFLTETAVTDAGVVPLLAQLPRLEALGLGKDHVGDETVAAIGELMHLRVLVLSNVKAKRETLARLAALHDLERLYLDGTAADASTVIALGGLGRLGVLHLTDTDVDDTAVPALRGLTGLTELAIGNTKIRAGVADLDAWPQLRTLSLYGQDIDDAKLAGFARVKTLAQLDLSVTDVTDPTALESLPNLRTLGLVNNRISKSGARAVKALAAAGVLVLE